MRNYIYSYVWSCWLYSRFLCFKNRKVGKKEEKMKHKLIFEISCDNGYTENVEATCRKEAVEEYLKTSGMPLWYFKEHCTVRNKALYGNRNRNT